MPAGGRRPGAGAPKGNTNALKSGRHSARFKAVLTAMSQVPEVRDYFALVRRRQLRSERLAAAVLRKALLELLAGFSRQKQSHPRLSEGKSPSFKKRLKKSVDNQAKENNQMVLWPTGIRRITIPVIPAPTTPSFPRKRESRGGAAGRRS